jgi:hypothetical protein
VDNELELQALAGGDPQLAAFAGGTLLASTPRHVDAALDLGQLAADPSEVAHGRLLVLDGSRWHGDGLKQPRQAGAGIGAARLL